MVAAARNGADFAALVTGVGVGVVVVVVVTLDDVNARHFVVAVVLKVVAVVVVEAVHHDVDVVKSLFE